jgi:hypothetical protein
MMRDLRGGIWWEWINKWGTTFYNLSASEIWSKNRDEFLVGGLIRRGTTFWPKKRDDFLVGGLIRRGTTVHFTTSVHLKSGPKRGMTFVMKNLLLDQTNFYCIWSSNQ